MIFRRFPYTTLNDINLDWIIKQVKQIAAALQGKQDKPDTTGTAGQVLGLDENLDPVWLDNGGGGGGTTNYNSLSNKPQINGVTLSGNKTAADLGLANASDIPTVPVQSVNGQTGAVVLDAADVGALPSNTFIPGYSLQLPIMDGEASAGTNMSRYAMEGHRHPTDTSRAPVDSVAYIRTGATNTGAQLEKGAYFYLDGVLKRAISTIPANAAFTSSNCVTITAGGLNDLIEIKTITSPFTKDSGADINVVVNAGVTRGGIAFINFEYTPGSALANWTLLGTISPAPLGQGFALCQNGYQVVLRTNGEIRVVGPTQPAGEQLRFYLIYPCDL